MTDCHLPLHRAAPGACSPRVSAGGWRRWLAGGVLALALMPALLPITLQAAGQLVTFRAHLPGKTPFIKLVRLHVDDVGVIDHVRFTINPKPGSVTRPISAQYSRAYLERRGFLDRAAKEIRVPVFGLYQDYLNTVEVVSGFADGTVQVNTLSIQTAHFDGGIYNHPTIVQARSPSTALSYDFIQLKAFSSGYSPIIIDTDGEIRWVGTANTPSMPSIYMDNSFFVSGKPLSVLRRMYFDGEVEDVVDYASQGIVNFHHNFDPGKYGIITDVTTPDYLECTNMEVSATGKVLHVWSLADIITSAMVAGGDDPTQFVAAKGSLVDWFHNNSAAYRPSDDSIIISSRENFVIALDYETNAIKWILGDPTKQWYKFPSLRKYALAGTAGTNYPVGQHALSIYQDKLLLFDNGYFSADHYPKGLNRTYSAPRKYLIDQAAGVATETWHHLARESIDSPICSSVYEDQPNNYLVDYATAGPNLYAEIMGLSPGGTRVFDYRFKELDTLATAWNATIIHLEDMNFD
jgi:arylsulfate sulfotransferase